jgi:hypothetical protein
MAMHQTNTFPFAGLSVEFSVGMSRPQNLQIFASRLIVSAQNGHCLVSEGLSAICDGAEVKGFGCGASLAACRS